MSRCALLLCAYCAMVAGSLPKALYADDNRQRRGGPVALALRAGAVTPSVPLPPSLVKQRMDSSASLPVAAKRHSVRSIVIKRVLAGWSVLQVVSILANAIRRLVPVALQPLIQNDMQPMQWAMYIGWSLYMGYAEGYQAFQLKFSPLVVKRAFGLSEDSAGLPMRVLSVILAGPYAMGLFGATRKRMVVSWSITAGVFAVVNVVKKLPYPYRAIVDAGVVVGLGYGTLSILWLAIRAMFGLEPDVDPCLPARTSKEE